RGRRVADGPPRRPFWPRAPPRRARRGAGRPLPRAPRRRRDHALPLARARRRGPRGRRGRGGRCPAMNQRVSTRLAARVPDVAKGVRAAIVMLVPFALAAAWKQPELSWTALGGWLGTLADPGGSRVTRARTITLFAAAGAAVVAFGEALVPWPLLATVGL